MMRTRLLWFTLGFSTTAAALAQFVYRDLWIDRHALAAEMNHKFDSLESRVSNLESIPPQPLNSAQVEG